MMDENISLNKSRLWKNFLGLFLILGSLFIIARFFDLEEIRSQIEAAGAVGPLLLIAAKAATIIIAPLGGSPLYPIAGAVFGFTKGSLYLILGDAFGGAVAFFISRYFGRTWVEKIMGNEKGLLSEVLEVMSTVKGFFLVRVCFLTFPELSCYGAGLTKINFWPFIFIYTLIGSIPTLVLASLGDVLTREGAGYLPVIFIINLIVLGAGLSVFARLVLKKRKAASSEGKVAVTPNEVDSSPPFESGS